MAEQFDVAIIGSGPGGYVAAVRGAQMGLKVAIIEKEPGMKMGGTCGLRGCIPTKALLNAAHLYEKAQHFENFGLKAEGLSYDFAKVQEYKSGVVNKNAAGVTYLLGRCDGDGALVLQGSLDIDGEIECAWPFPTAPAPHFHQYGAGFAVEPVRT